MNLKNILSLVKASTVRYTLKKYYQYIITGCLLILLIMGNIIQSKTISLLEEEASSLKSIIGELPKPEEFTEEKNKSLGLLQENNSLREAILYLESKKQEIRTVVMTKSTIKGVEEFIRVCPNDYTFKLSNGMPVARLTGPPISDTYEALTYDITFHSEVVISEKETLVRLTGRSSGDSTVYELPVEVDTFIKSSDEQKKSIFNPQLAIGISQSIPSTNIEAVIALPILEGPKKQISWIAPTISVSERFKIGLTPIMYNIAKPVPLIDNLWLGLGWETDVTQQYINISLTAKI